MEHLLKELIEKAKGDKRLLIRLKNAAVAGQSFELASALREMERELFPETEQEKIAKDLNILFRMVDLDIPGETCWVIYETLTIWKKKKGAFSLKDSAKILADKKKIFGE